MPETFTRPVDETSEGIPYVSFIKPDSGITFLTQEIEPMSLIQLSQDSQKAKFAASDYENSRAAGNQLPNLYHECMLQIVTAVSFDMSYPGPHNCNFIPEGQVDNKQLITKADFGAVYYSADFSQFSELNFQP
jgi:hypothetical protein